MGQVEEQRYVCRICSKPCVSGKSLGGHMRAHLASKKSSVNVNPNCVEEFGDSEESKHTRNSCRECGKEFASLRALSGHMRCHSIKNDKEVHSCKECGRGFESMRAVFGHMKSHSTKRVMMKVVSSVVVENFCPVRRKRSGIKYKGTVSASPSFSGVDASHCGASEAEEAARCLVMLSRGVGSFSKLVSDSDHSGGVVASNVSEFENGMEVDLDLVCDEGFLKDGIGSNGCDGESCDHEMVEEKHRATSSDPVEQEMESGGISLWLVEGSHEHEALQLTT